MERKSIEKKIVSLLRNTSLNTLEISSRLNIDRHTAIKYLESMESKGIISKETKRRAKVWSVSKTPVADILKREDIVSKQLAEILDTVDQHISIQDSNYKIIWKNKYAKSINNSPKCHEAYFDQSHRCKNCPVEKTFKTGKQEKREEKTKGGIRTIITKPLKDEKNNTIAIVEIIKDSKL